MKKVDPDSFFGRLFLNGIDKLAFTLLLLLIFAVWTAQQQKDERDSVHVERINSIEIERPIALVEDLLKPVRQCLLFVRLNRIRGITSDKKKAELQSLVLEIEVDSKMIGNYMKNRDMATTSQAAYRLGDLVREFGVDVLTGKEVGRMRYDVFLRQLEDQYDLLFESTIKDAVAAISGPAEESGVWQTLIGWFDTPAVVGRRSQGDH